MTHSGTIDDSPYGSSVDCSPEASPAPVWDAVVAGQELAFHDGSVPSPRKPVTPETLSRRMQLFLYDSNTVARKKDTESSRLKFIEPKQRRNGNFYKRRSGLMKKGFELSMLTGAEVMVISVIDNNIFSYSTKKLEKFLSSKDGQSIIQKSLKGKLEESESSKMVPRKPAAEAKHRPWDPPYSIKRILLAFPKSLKPKNKVDVKEDMQTKQECSTSPASLQSQCSPTPTFEHIAPSSPGCATSQEPQCCTSPSDYGIQSSATPSSQQPASTTVSGMAPPAFMAHEPPCDTGTNDHLIRVSSSPMPQGVVQPAIVQPHCVPPQQQTIPVYMQTYVGNSMNNSPATATPTMGTYVQPAPATVAGVGSVLYSAYSTDSAYHRRQPWSRCRCSRCAATRPYLRST